MERVKSGVVMKDILDCYPGIGSYFIAFSAALVTEMYLYCIMHQNKAI